MERSIAFQTNRVFSLARGFRAALAWLVDMPADLPAEMRHKLVTHSLLRKKTLVFSIVVSVLVAAIAVVVSGERWTFVWLLAELAIGAARFASLQAFGKARRRGETFGAMAATLSNLIWFAILAIAYVQCVLSGNWLLILLAGISAAGIVGGASSRNAGTPRYAILVMCMVTLPYSIATIMSPIPYLWIAGVQIPLCLIGMIMVLYEQQGVLIGLYKAEHENYLLAHYDALTGLPNRVMKQKRFDDILNAAAPAWAPADSFFTVLCLDLDGFKDVNDRFGHAAGDQVLQQAAARLRASIREGDVVSRVGGDEFVILLTPVTAVDVEVIAQRIITRVSAAFTIDGGSVSLGISIGGARAPRDGTTSAELLRSADRALYEAKRRGKGTYVAHHPEIADSPSVAPTLNDPAAEKVSAAIGFDTRP